MTIVPISKSDKKNSDILFICMSFENIRWNKYLNENFNKYKKVVLFYNIEFEHLYKDYIADFENPSLYKLVQTSINKPLYTADNYVETVEQYKEELIDIDISTFTHEHLCILFKVFSYIKYKKEINLIYATVNEYSVGKVNGWLSKGVREIRNILGYSGNLLPSKPLHLIVLVGLENERVQKIIEEYEPAKITIGKCSRDSSVGNNISKLNEEHYERIDFFIKQVISNIKESEEFEFSCTIPEETYRVLNKIINNNSEYNNIIVAGNSKISTLGVVKLALENEDLQLCYAQPLEYNINGYTEGVKNFKFFQAEFNLI